MRIVVCFRMVYELDQITPEELYRLRDGELNLSVFRRILGSWDEAALETALCAADEVRRTGRECETVAVTLDSVDDPTVKNLYGAGFHRIVAVSGSELRGNRPMEEAALLSTCIQELGGDLILISMQDEPEEHGQLPVLLAQLLRCPCAEHVTGISVAEAGLCARMDTDLGKAELRIRGRAVCGVGEAEHSFLRVATLRDKLAVRNRTVEAWSPESIPGGRYPELKLSRLLYEYVPRQCCFLKGNTPEEQARLLWEKYLQEEEQA